MIDESLSYLKAINVSAGFAQPVIKDVSFDVSPGKSLIIAGPNGAGKSTLLRTAARLLLPMGGSVQLNGEDAYLMQPSEFARKVAFVPQQSSASARLTVRDAVALGRNPHQTWWQWSPTAEDRAAMEHALEITGMSQFRDKLLAELSGGERQRASIAMALAQNPEFLLLDEPTSHLDFKHQLDLTKMIESLKQKGTAIVAVVHDLNFASRVGDELILIEKNANAPSTVAVQGRPQDVLTRESIKRVYDVEMQIIENPDRKSRIFSLM